MVALRRTLADCYPPYQGTHGVEFDHVRVEAQSKLRRSPPYRHLPGCWESAVPLILVAVFFRQQPIQMGIWNAERQ
jgi:hypothetical protein